MFYSHDIFDDALRLRNTFNNYFGKMHTIERGREEPLVSLYENGDTITVKTFMPGVKLEDLNVELADRILNIEGEKRNDNTEGRALRRERTFGKFKKSISLPFEVNRSNIKASLADGIFTVTLEKSEQMKSRKIEIQ